MYTHKILPIYLNVNIIINMLKSYSYPRQAQSETWTVMLTKEHLQNYNIC